MKIADLAIQFRTSVLVLTGIVLLGGVFAYVTLPKESAPSIAIPQIIVTSVYPGASPDDVEALVTKQIEQEMQSLSGVKEIRSNSVESVSTVVIEFNPDQDIDDASQKVREKVDLAKADLPEDVEEPIVDEIDTSEFPIMNINLAAPYPLSRLKKVAEDLQDQIEQISSVLEVILVGGIEREVQINVDLLALQAYNLSFHDIVETVQRENINIPGGSVDVDHLNYLVRVDGEIQRPVDLERLVIKAPGGQPIYVRDVAKVAFGFKDRSSHSRLRLLTAAATPAAHAAAAAEYGQVITLVIKKRAGENIIDTATQIQAVLDGFAFPPSTEVVITGDESQNVRVLVKDLENNIISGLLCVVAVLLFFLGTRTSLLVGIAIPLSMGVSFMTFMALGYTLNFIILFSLIIALGMLVDNAVVLVENIYRFLEMGHPPFEAASLGTQEVGMPVVASTATTVAAFVPMLFWPGMIGEFMSYMPLTLIVTLSCSLFVAIIINPVLTGYFARVDGQRVGKMSRWMVAVGVIGGAQLIAVLGFANQTAMWVLVGGGFGLFVLNKVLLKPIGDRMIKTGLPKLIGLYRRFLQVMLWRDYSVRWAYLRNMTGLLSLALAAAFGVFGGLAYAVGGFPASLVFLAPGAAFGAVGLASIVLHSVESLFVGAGKSMLAGVAIAAVMGAVIGIVVLRDGYVQQNIAIGLMAPAGLVFGLGLLGLSLRGRRTLILTDNRARLMHLVLGSLFAIVGMFVVAPTGTAFFPDTDPNVISVAIRAPLGTNLETSNALAREGQRRIDAFLAGSVGATANTKSVLVNVGIGGSDIFGGGAGGSPERSRVTLNLRKFDKRFESSAETMRHLRAQLKGIPNAEIEFKRDQAGPPTGAAVNLEISGPNFKEIVRIAGAIKARLKTAVEAGKIKGLVDIRDNLSAGRPQVAVRIDREAAAQFGLDTRTIAGAIRTAINGTKASTYRDEEDDFDITVRLAKADRDSLESLRKLNIMHEGTQIPLVAVARFELGSGLGSITRKDQRRVVTVLGNAAQGANAQKVLGQVVKVLEPFERTLPPDYAMAYTGENQEQEKSFSFLTSALATGATLIMMILIAQFNSVLTPFIIMLAVALSLIGVLLGMILTRSPFGLFTFIGVISLAGIVVNNNIVLIDYTIQLRDRGLSKAEAIIEAGATRLRPVLLTAMTTVIGLIPLTFGINIDFVGLLTDFAPDFRIGSENTQFWGPMGTAIISGLTFATFLTLVIVPVMYSLFDSTATRAAAVFGRRPLETQVPETEPQDADSALLDEV